MLKYTKISLGASQIRFLQNLYHAKKSNYSEMYSRDSEHSIIHLRINTNSFIKTKRNKSRSEPGNAPRIGIGHREGHIVTLTFKVATQILYATRRLNMVIIYMK